MEEGWAGANPSDRLLCGKDRSAAHKTTSAPLLVFAPNLAGHHLIRRNEAVAALRSAVLRSPFLFRSLT